MWPFSKQKTLETNGFFRRKSYWFLYGYKEGHCKKMLAVLLLSWVISSSTASVQCPGGKCSCPDYRRAICTGYLKDSFTNLLDSRLQSLTLQNTNIKEVACDTLPEGIEILLLRENRKLKNITFNCDWMLTVRHLEISAAEISELYPITEQHNGSLGSSDCSMLESLQKLYLSNLQISDHLDLLLKCLTNIRELQLIRGEIPPLINIEPKLPYVELLDLSNNPIKNISVEFFRSMINLKTLQLEWTKLTNVSRDIFHPLKKLSILRLDGNNFTSFEDDSFLQLNNLRKLRLSKNQIKYFQSALTRDLKNLEDLFLNENKLTELEEQVFDSLEELRVLNLTQNILTNISKIIFKKQRKLQRLYLGWNKLENLEAATLAPLSNLHTLNLERNRLKFLEEKTFEKLSKLRLLYLSGNSLTEISGIQFPQRAVLQQLFLDWNSLENLDPMTFRPLGALQRLRLDGNNFRNVYVELFEYLDDLKYLNLSECNMLNCSCSVEKLWKLCKQRNITLADGAICNVDNNHSIQWSILKICPLEKSETEYINIIIIASVLVLVLIVSIPVIKYLLKRARSDTSTWCPENHTDNSINRQNTQVPKEEDYDFVSAEGKPGLSILSMVHQEDYVEPRVPKVSLPVCKPMNNPKKVKRRKVSIPLQPVVTSPEITVPEFTSHEITVPQGKAPAAPPEDYYAFLKARELSQPSK